MKISLKIGDVVLVDLGMVAKVRPCLVLAPNPDSERSVAIVAPLTTEIRGGESEITFPKPAWLNSTSVLNLSGIAAVERARIQHRLGPFPPAKLKEAQTALAKILGLEHPPGQFPT
jgi:mRNA interferase MazF